MQNNVAADGSTREVTEHVGQLLSLDARGDVKTWQSGVGISNTVAWSLADDLMYFGDTLRNEIYAYDYDKSSQQISHGRVFSEGFDRGLPDGSAMDAEGFLWNCRYGGACIVRIAPSGAIDRVVEMPTANITNCTFGGDGLKTLYITTAALGASPSDRFAGGLFALKTDVAGQAENRFQR